MDTLACRYWVISHHLIPLTFIEIIGLRICIVMDCLRCKNNRPLTQRDFSEQAMLFQIIISIQLHGSQRPLVPFDLFSDDTFICLKV